MAEFSIFDTISPEETEALGRDLAPTLRGQKILLFGDLGLGKTTLLRGLAAGLGVTEPVKSPTFVYEHIHELSAGERFAHLDLYRLESGPSIELAEHLRELFADPATTVAVEWSERLPDDLLPTERVEIRFDAVGEDGRQIRVEWI